MLSAKPNEARHLPAVYDGPMIHAALLLLAATFPEAQISNGQITAKFHLPDPVNGSYQGTRFDWSGIIYSLTYRNHEYFGQWYPKHDPKIHDAITGPVEEFRTGDAGLGYAEAKPGGVFVRIGVGVVRKPDEPAYQTFRTYEIVDHGTWKNHVEKDRITFTHELTAPGGYAYRYTKTVRLVKGKPEMVIDHALRNVGDKLIETTQYNHNFFVIDGAQIGPDVKIQFGFEPSPAANFRGREAAEFKNREIVYGRDLKPGESVFSELKGYGSSDKDYSFVIENRKSGAGVRIKGDRPISKMVFWSINTVACPEPYISLRVEPGKTEKWSTKYEFYAAK